MTRQVKVNPQIMWEAVLKANRIMFVELGITQAIMQDNVKYLAFRAALEHILLQYEGCLSVGRVTLRQRAGADGMVTDDQGAVGTKYLIINEAWLGGANDWVVQAMCNALPPDWASYTTSKGQRMIYPKRGKVQYEYKQSG